jgi:hypothetical protein
MWRPVKTEGAALWTYSNDQASKPFTHAYKKIAPPANLNQTVFLPNETFSYAEYVCPHRSSRLQVSDGAATSYNGTALRRHRKMTRSPA